MFKHEIKVGITIISPEGKPWKVTKQYDRNLYLIRRKRIDGRLGKLVALTTSQFRYFHKEEDHGKQNKYLSPYRQRARRAH